MVLKKAIISVIAALMLAVAVAAPAAAALPDIFPPRCC